MRAACAACGAAALRPYLEVRPPAGDPLVPTADRYGSAPADLVRCAACGHGQVAAFPPEAALAGDYAAAADPAHLDEERGQRRTAAAALERIERHVPVGALCDLGCWLGFLLAEAERRGWEAWGVEPSRYASELARRRHGLKVITATMDRAPLPERHFGAVVLADVIEHLPRPGAALELAARVLAPNGVVYLALPDGGSAAARTLGSRWWSVLPAHVQYFTRASVATLLARHSFAVEWMGTAPKAFSVRYYLGRVGGYSRPLAAGAVRAADALGLGERMVAPDLRDRMAVVARLRS